MANFTLQRAAVKRLKKRRRRKNILKQEIYDEGAVVTQERLRGRDQANSAQPTGDPAEMMKKAEAAGAPIAS